MFAFPIKQVFLIITIFTATLRDSCVFAIRSFPSNIDSIKKEIGDDFSVSFRFQEAPDYRNGPECPKLNSELICDPLLVHIAMTLDVKYIRGTVAAVHSVVKHTSCPGNIFFHFIASSSSFKNVPDWTRILQTTFPSLRFKVYVFDENLVNGLISPSIRQALENPLNYARNYLAHMLDPCVKKVIYLDSDVIVVDDIQKLWKVSLTGSRAVGATEYCHANFAKYFTNGFWSDPEMTKVFEGKTPCYFNTGVMLLDMVRWREGEYTRKIERWMEIQKERRIYELGSLPPFLLVFGGEIEAIDRRWNQHGLGGDNVISSCRSLHPGPVSLMHWSGKEKPWTRLDSKMPCPVDNLWMPYDLHKPRSQS